MQTVKRGYKLLNTGRTGIYMRLSRDDEKLGESMSIENQRKILLNYVSENNGVIADEYIDDGWSGTDFERPAVKRLLNDAKDGKLDTIVVKDLSRFGRNYILVGQYVDYIFPAYGIRFIALADNVDTADRNSAGMDMMPVMNVFNEWHAASTSKKIRAVLEANQRTGRYTGWSYPYGYRAGNDDNRTAVTDEYAATVVRRIFDMRLQGNSLRSIARILTDEHIPNPATYFTRADGKKSLRHCSPYWSAKTVGAILSDCTYTGCTVQHKTTCVSYKNHSVVKVPQSRQIIKENAHEAIISREIWQRVQSIGSSSCGKKDGSGRLHALSGMLVCADCGKKLKGKYSGSGRLYCYCCRTYCDLGKQYCTPHRISEAELEKVVLSDIRSMCSVKIDEAVAANMFIKKIGRRDVQKNNRHEKQLAELSSRITELDKLIKATFEERVLGDMNAQICAELCDKYRQEKILITRQITELEKITCSTDSSGAKTDKYIEKLKSYCNCERLTREMSLALIEFITVGEDLDGKREINIYYKFSATDKK